MTDESKIRIVYVTSSDYKVDENRILQSRCKLSDDRLVSDVFEFEFRRVPIAEMLETDISVMVQAEVVNAYSQISVPCVVEHAGLIFEGYEDRNYPGGLTKPMWDTLGRSFVRETNSEGRRAIARAVVAYCDGMQTLTFIGETKGTLAKEQRGKRAFYWDTVFMPDDPKTGEPGKETYAEIVDHEGLEYKVVNLSQSTKAMIKFLNYRISAEPALWS